MMAGYQPDAGYLAASDCVITQAQMAQRYGATLLTQTPVVRVEVLTDSVRVHTADAQYEAGRLVVVQHEESIVEMTDAQLAEAFGNDGDDTLIGGDFVDMLTGGPGDDTLIGNGYGDGMSGDEGNDTLNGGPGSDTLDGGADSDICDGGPDTDYGMNCETVSSIP